MDFDVGKRIEELTEYLRKQTATRGQALTITKLDEARFWYEEYQKELKFMRERAGVAIR